MTLRVNDRLTSENGTTYIVELVAAVVPPFQYGPEPPAEPGALQVRLRPEPAESTKK